MKTASNLSVVLITSLFIALGSLTQLQAGGFLSKVKSRASSYSNKASSFARSTVSNSARKIASRAQAKGKSYASRMSSYSKSKSKTWHQKTRTFAQGKGKEWANQARKYTASKAKILGKNASSFAKSKAVHWSRNTKQFAKQKLSKYRPKLESHSLALKKTIEKTAKKWGSNSKPMIQSYYSKFKPVVASKLHAAHQNYGPKLASAANILAVKIVDSVKDPKNQRLAVSAAVTAMVLHEKFDEVKKKASYVAVSTVMKNVYVENDNGQRVSLENYSKQWIARNCPYLKDTAIGQDPTKAFTYGIVYRDVDYITKEMKIISRGKEMMSIADAIEHESPTNYENTMRLIETADAFSTLIDERAGFEDIQAASKLISMVNSY